MVNVTKIFEELGDRIPTGRDVALYDEESQKLINMRNQGAMLSDPTVREGYVQGAVARGMEAAGSNEAGTMNAFLGMGMGMNMQGNILGQMPVQQATPAQQAVPAANTWTCTCGSVNSGKFCSECGNPVPATDWVCTCGTKNSGKFCSECGKPRA